MKKICVITAARSEYGYLKWLIHDLKESDKFELQVVVTGGHLSYKQGHTIDDIIDDGISITTTVDINLDTSNEVAIAQSMGRMAEKFAVTFEKIKPDYLIVLGDRYELMPICSTAFVMRIPIIHISGGDVTEGAIDDGIRNAVTMMAEYHFPGTEAAAKNIVRMRGNDKNIWVVGELGLDAFNKEKLMDKLSIAKSLGLDIDKKWVLMTYHAETRKGLKYNINVVNNCIDLLSALDGYQTIVTYANADFGGLQINELIEKRSDELPDKIKVIPSLGHLRYLSFMCEVSFVIGNSSSGIVEAPFLNTPVINIGDRQKGRYQCHNIIQCGSSRKEIKDKIREALVKEKIKTIDRYYWGNGHASEKIVEILNSIIS